MLKHGKEQTRPSLDKVIAVLKEESVTKSLHFDLAFDNVIQCIVVSHPSLFTVPDDLKVPLLINSCEVDQMFPAEAQAKADEIFGDGKFAPGYKREYFSGCTHGFSVRGDMTDPLVKAGKE
ncbi:hypothetical protein BD769DRAFT_1679889 [Suillus cothurnatus]|nr:hypothetical protein BD769DRAFT_1679889 [Suillus cothurnatus]